jgi:hypothetical protein
MDALQPEWKVKGIFMTCMDGYVLTIYREPISGLTFERPTPAGELAESQDRILQCWAIGFYNKIGSSLKYPNIQVLTMQQALRYSATYGATQINQTGISLLSSHKAHASSR